MSSDALVSLALGELQCNQKELAVRLGVSPTQISKWKKGEHMSSEMEARLRSLAGIGEMEPDLVQWAGSLPAARKWEKLMKYLAAVAKEDAETGYYTDPLSDPFGLLFAYTASVLDEMGVERPREFPSELDLDYEEQASDEAQLEKLWETITANPYASMIDDIYHALNDVYGFYAAYVADLIYDETLNLSDTDACNIEPCLIDLAATKINVDTSFASNANAFRRKVNEEFGEWINLVKEQAFRHGVPLRAELMDLVSGSQNDLSHSAEAESLGFNAKRIHPDVYMNELLVGMRVIQQVLPAIMKKLGMEMEFALDESESPRIP